MVAGAAGSSYKVRQLCLLQSATRWYYKVRQLCFFPKCDKVEFRNATAILLQSVTSVITKCDKCCLKVRQVLQSATVHTFFLLQGQKPGIDVCCVFHEFLVRPLVPVLLLLLGLKTREHVTALSGLRLSVLSSQ